MMEYGHKVENLKQGLNITEDLTIELSEKRESPYLGLL